MQSNVVNILNGSLWINKWPNSMFVCNENKAYIHGFIEEEFTYSHSSGKWGKFYTTRIGIVRNSGAIDYVPILVSQNQIDRFPKGSLKGLRVEICGALRTYIIWARAGQKSNLKLFLFPQSIKCYKNDEVSEMYAVNEIYLKGILKTQPVERKTASGKKIVDFILKVKRKNDHFDVIPCIAWENNAEAISNMKIGEEIEVLGRIQSREYFKRVAPGAGEGETKVTYEVSVFKFSK